MLALAWQTIKARAGGFVGAFLAVLCGTALTCACGILIDSGLRAGVPTERYAAAAVVVAGNQTVRPPGVEALDAQSVTEQAPIPANLVGAVAAVPGVRAAVAEVTFPAHVVVNGQPLAGPPSYGHNWDSAVLAPVTLRAGGTPTGPGQVVLDTDLAGRAGVSVGQRVRIETAAGTVDYQVVGIASALSRQGSLYFAADQANKLYDRPGQAYAIGVLPQPGVSAGDLADRVAAALPKGGVSVTEGGDRSTVEFSDVGQARTALTAISGSFAGVALLVTVFVVASTLALSVQQRRREFALLRAIGATPKQVRRLIGTETTLVALVAGVLGGLGGIAVANGLRAAFAKIGVLPTDFALAIDPIPVVGSVLLGLGAARLAALVAARRPSRISPIEALGEAAVERKALGLGRTITGWVFCLLGVGVSTIPLYLHNQIAAGMAGIAALLIVIGLSLLGPKVVGFAIALIARPLGRFSRIGGYLAAANSRANTRRVAAAVTPLMLAVGFAITMFFSQTIGSAAVQRETELATTADHVLTSSTGGLSPQVVDAVRRTPGVSTATEVVRTHVMITTREDKNVRIETDSAIGLDGNQVRGNLDLGGVQGDLTQLRGDTVALSAGEASWLDKRIGDQVDFFFGDGAPARLRLVATYGHDFAFGDWVLPAELARAHTTDRLDSSVLVRLDPAADDATVTAALRGLAGQFPGLQVADRSTMLLTDGSQQREQMWVNLVAVGVVLGYIAISVANTLVMTTARRSREFALLRLVGATKRQVRRMMRIEAWVLAGIAVVIGSLIPVLPLGLLGIGFAGTPIPAGPIGVYLAIVGVAVALGLLAMAVPTRLTLRARPIDTIGLRE